MKKNIIYIITFAILCCSVSMASDDNCYSKIPQKPTYKERKELDKLLDERLQLTSVQKEIIKKNRAKHFDEMKKIVDRMQVLHNKIRNVYLSGIPQFQAEIKTAAWKGELAILKQNAERLRQENRKNFENILTQEQKVEFEKLRKELSAKRNN